VRPLSLQVRVSAAVIALLGIVVLVICASAHREFEEALFGHLDGESRAMSKMILEAAADAPNLEALDSEASAIAGTIQRRSEVRYWVWTDGEPGTFLTNDPAQEKPSELFQAILGEEPPGRAKSFCFGKFPGGYRIHWRRRTIRDKVVNVALGRISDRAFEESDEFYRVLVGLGGATILITAIATALLVRWGLRPITLTASRLQGVTAGNIGQSPFPDRRLPSELVPFSDALSDMLARLDGALTRQKQFTADASHELRTPLSVAKSSLQLAASRDREGSEYRRAIGEALDELARMEHLIRELLTLARLDEGASLPSPAPVRLDLLIARVGASLDADALSAGGRIIFGPLPSASVQGDENLLERMLHNLVENAIKYGPPRGDVRIALERGEDSAWLLSVHDEGGGLSPEDQENLFDRFVRLDHSRSRKTGGAGLGLAIAREIAQRHGGDIHIASAPESGTTVTVRLPGA
jgi:signal transduction histidine kinase